jgi:NAD(P)-dependent dehydrogenase (short-subunit alcohol dehydrogenase family)
MEYEMSIFSTKNCLSSVAPVVWVVNWEHRLYQCTCCIRWFVRSAYAMVKVRLHALIRNLAIESAHTGIRVKAVSSGIVHTSIY